MRANLSRQGSWAQHAPVSRGSTPADFPAGRATVVVLVVTAIFVLTQLYAAIPLVSPVTDDLRGEATFALSTSFSLAYAAGFLIWGPISDRFGRKRVIAFAVGALAVTTLMCATASSVPVMAGVRALQGLSAAGFAPVALAYLSEASPPSRRGGAIGAMSTAFLVAGIFGQVLASTVALRLGWSWFFVLCGVVLAIMFLLILTLLTDAPQRASSLSLLKQFGSLARLAVTPAIVLLSVAHVTLLLSFVALYTSIGEHLASLDVPASGIILIRLAALPAMFVSLSVGALAKRFSMVRVAQAGFTLAGVGLLGEAVFSGTLSGLVAVSFVYVSGVALAIPSMINLYGETAATNRGSGMAINGFILFVGASIGPFVGGAPINLNTLATILFGLLAVATVSILGFSKLSRKAVTS